MSFDWVVKIWLVLRKPAVAFLRELPFYPRWVKAVFSVWAFCTIAVVTLLLALLAGASEPHMLVSILLNGEEVAEGKIEVFNGEDVVRSLEIEAGNFDEVVKDLRDLDRHTARLITSAGTSVASRFLKLGRRQWALQFTMPPPVVEHSSKYPALNRSPGELSDEELEQYVGQLFIVGFDGGWWRQEGDVAAILEPIARPLVRELGVGGVLLFERNVPFFEATPDYYEPREAGLFEAIARMKHASAASSGLPLIVTTDFEGGGVQQIRGRVMTEMPSAMALGALRNEGAARAAGRIIGSELRAFGFNMNLGPVVDINTNSHNDLIGDRSFGGNPDLVRTLAGAFVRGQLGEGILAVAKHFPGHGSTGQGDESPGVPLSGLEPFSLAAALIPFKALIGAGVPAIMSSHFRIESLSPQTVTFEARYTSDLLRSGVSQVEDTHLKSLDFEGVLISDDLCSPTITADNHADNSDLYVERVSDAARKAFDAGHDMLVVAHIFADDASQEKLRPPGKLFRTHLRLNEFRNVHDALRQHIFRDGHPERVERLRQSLSRIWQLKHAVEEAESHPGRIPSFNAISEGKEGMLSWASALKALRQKHEEISRDLTKESFSVLRLAPEAPDLSRLPLKSRIALVFPTRHTSYEAVAGADEDNIDLNVEASDLPRAIRDLWGERFDVQFHMQPRWFADQDRERLRERAAGFAAEQGTRAVLYVIWNRRQWELLCEILAAMEEHELSKVFAIVTAYPNLLDGPTNEQKRLLDSITIVVAYRGARLHAQTLAQFLLEGKDKLRRRPLPVRVLPWVDAVLGDIESAEDSARWEQRLPLELEVQAQLPLASATAIR